jgi:mRNA interferase MazF
MRQGDIYWADLESTLDQEQQGLRPVVIISGNTMNKKLNLRIICPLTRKVKNLKGCVVLKKSRLNNLEADSEILPFHVRSVTISRLKTKIGEINSDELERIKGGLLEILTY